MTLWLVYVGKGVAAGLLVYGSWLVLSFLWKGDHGSQGNRDLERSRRWRYLFVFWLGCIVGLTWATHFDDKLLHDAVERFRAAERAEDACKAKYAPRTTSGYVLDPTNTINVTSGGGAGTAAATGFTTTKLPEKGEE